MDGQGKRTDEEVGLNRIIALLFSLATLAESLCHRSAPLRMLVLWILRPALHVARRCVFDDTGFDAGELEPDFIKNSSMEAKRLAAYFYLLATVLEEHERDCQRWQEYQESRCARRSGKTMFGSRFSDLDARLEQGERRIRRFLQSPSQWNPDSAGFRRILAPDTS